MDAWIGETVGRMHMHGITQAELAARIGFRRDYLNKILSGRLAPKGARERIVAALDDLIQQREQQTA